MDKGLESWVQEIWAVVKKEPELIMEVFEGDGGERAQLI